MRRAEELRAGIGAWSDLEERAEALADMAELAAAEDTDGMEALRPDLERDLAALEADWARMEQQLLLSEPFDEGSAIVSVYAGAGGTESQDWAEMLLRMYMRWIERRGFKREVIDYQPGDEAGLKSATVTVQGEFAFGLLSAEAGVHRLVRISPFDSNARRHTSFANARIYPVIDDRIVIDIKESDVRTDTMRASGAGGQHVNKTDSAIRLTHIPTNIVVQCQQDRSQHRNRAMAWDMLRAKLYEAELRKREEKAAAEQAAKTDIGWGHQIRSYVLQPYQMVKDLRTGVSTSDTGGVLDGDLDQFMQAVLAQKAFGTGPESVEDVD